MQKRLQATDDWYDRSDRGDPLHQRAAEIGLRIALALDTKPGAEHVARALLFAAEYTADSEKLEVDRLALRADHFLERFHRSAMRFDHVRRRIRRRNLRVDDELDRRAPILDGVRVEVFAREQRFVGGIGFLHLA